MEHWPNPIEDMIKSILIRGASTTSDVSPWGNAGCEILRTEDRDSPICISNHGNQLPWRVGTIPTVAEFQIRWQMSISQNSANNPPKS